jgi:hypothetical protein
LEKANSDIGTLKAFVQKQKTQMAAKQILMSQLDLYLQTKSQEIEDHGKEITSLKEANK